MTNPDSKNTPALRIGCIGEAMIELSTRGDNLHLGFAGDVLNTAVYLKRTIGNAAHVHFISVLGKDDYSRRMLDFIESHGILTRHIGRHESRVPGLYAISTDTNGERSFAYWRENSAARTLFQKESGIDFSVLQQFDVVYLSAITLAILPQDVRLQLLEALEGYRGQVAFDSNYRPGLWEDQAVARHCVERVWQRTDIALPSLDDELALFGDNDEAAVLQRFAGYGTRKGALKRGISGPLSFEPIKTLPTFQPAKTVVDTTAAGDSFNGGYLGACLQNGEAAEAIQSGHELALQVIAKAGAIVDT